MGLGIVLGWFYPAVSKHLTEYRSGVWRNRYRSNLNIWLHEL